MSESFATIGACRTVGGKTNAALIAGVGIASVFGLMSYWSLPLSDPKNIAIVAAAAGIGAAALAYLTCSGVEYGIPYRRRK